MTLQQLEIQNDSELEPDPVGVRRVLEDTDFITGESFPEPRPLFGEGLIRQAFQCVLVLAMAVGSYWFFSQHVLQSVQVAGTSMDPTLKNSEHYLMDRWTYLIRDPQPNDIVVLRDPADNRLAVKRIIGREGDSISLKNGRVILNGRVLDEPYLPRNTRTFSYETSNGDQWVICGQNQFFVLGDNRDNSEDSRVYGAIPRENIIGMIMR